VEKAFPLVFWKRLTLMDEDSVSNRLEALRSLSKDIMTEIRESKEAIDLVNALKKRFSGKKYRSLEHWVNSKAWLREVKEDLDDYYKRFADQLTEKLVGADPVRKAKIYVLAQLKLPPEMAERFKAPSEIEIEVTPENIARLAKIDKTDFQHGKEALQRGDKTFQLTGRSALKWLTKYGK